MFTISRKAKETISLTVSIACLLISALWIYYHATLTGDTNLSDLTGFYIIMWGSSLPFGGFFLGPYIAPAVAALAGFFSTSNYWHTDRPILRAVSRVTLIAHGILTAALANPDNAGVIMGQVNYGFSLRITPENADLRGGNNLPAMAFSISVAGV